jgi:hypothetical protein
MRTTRTRRSNTTASTLRMRRLPLQIITHRLQVVIELRRIFLPLFSNFSDNWIIFHGRSINCSGVTILGAGYPKFSQVRSILSASAALAKWRQFHVSMNDVRCTAAIAI